jgi:hypothetical protein
MFKQESTARTKVDLNELIQQVIAVAKGPIESNNIVLETNLTDDVPPLVTADPVQLQHHFESGYERCGSHEPLWRDAHSAAMDRNRPR